MSLLELASLVASVLTDYLDRRQAARLAQRMDMPSAMAPLMVDSLQPEGLALAVRVWQPAPHSVAT